MSLFTSSRKPAAAAWWIGEGFCWLNASDSLLRLEEYSLQGLVRSGRSVQSCSPLRNFSGFYQSHPQLMSPGYPCVLP